MKNVAIIEYTGASKGAIRVPEVHGFVDLFLNFPNSQKPLLGGIISLFS